MSDIVQLLPACEVCGRERPVCRYCHRCDDWSCNAGCMFCYRGRRAMSEYSDMTAGYRDPKPPKPMSERCPTLTDEIVYQLNEILWRDDPASSIASAASRLAAYP